MVLCGVMCCSSSGYITIYDLTTHPAGTPIIRARIPVNPTTSSSSSMPSVALSVSPPSSSFTSAASALSPAATTTPSAYFHPSASSVGWGVVQVVKGVEVQLNLSTATFDRAGTRYAVLIDEGAFLDATRVCVVAVLSPTACSLPAGC